MPRRNCLDISGDSLLWIDDELSQDSAPVLLLELEVGNLEVECVQSGALGLRLALDRSYSGIILDLRLPGADGLTILRCLRVARVATPVLVASGWADAESTVAALRLGAIDVRSKPLLGDALVDAAVALLSRSRSGTVNGFNSVNAGLQTCESLSVARAAHALADAALSAPAFVCLARACKRALVGRGDDGSDIPTVSRPRELADQDHKPTDRTVTRLQEIATYIEAELGGGNLMSEHDLAERFNLGGAALGRLIRLHTGARFPEFRRAVRIKPTMRHVAYTQEQVAQIAYQHSYQHATQYQRDFVATLGISPNRFRRYCSSDGE